MYEQDDSLVQGDAHICHDADRCSVNEQESGMVMHEVPSETTNKQKGSPSRLHKIIFGILCVLVLGVIGVGVFVYRHSVTDSRVEWITTKLPFPAISVGRQLISYRVYYEEKQTIKKYFSSAQMQGNQVPTDDQIHTIILQALSNRAAVKKFASDYGVTMDPKKVEEYFQNFLATNKGQSTEQIEKQLEDTFGLSLSEFKERMVKPMVLSTEVAAYVEKSDFFQKLGRDEIQSAYTRVTEKGEDFETVGKEVHERLGIQMKNDIGFLKKSDLPPSWAEKVVNLEKDQISEVIDLPQGYVIFKLADRIKSQEATDKKTSIKKGEAKAEPVDEQLHLIAISIPKKNFDQILQAYLQTHPPKILMKI